MHGGTACELESLRGRAWAEDHALHARPSPAEDGDAQLGGDLRARACMREEIMSRHTGMHAGGDHQQHIGMHAGTNRSSVTCNTWAGMREIAREAGETWECWSA